MKSAGFSLVETLVGLTITVLLLLTLFGSVSVQQAIKRNAVHSDSAMTQAMTGLYFMSDDIKSAGLGFFFNNDFVCNSINLFYNGNIIGNSAAVTPVKIIPGANNLHQITVMHANSSLAGAPSKLLATMTSASSAINVNLAAASGLSSLAMLAQPGTNLPCTVIGVTDVNTVGNSGVIKHDPVLSLYNPSNLTSAFTTFVNYDDQAVLINLTSFTWRTWRVNNSRLEILDNITGNVEQIADNVVSLYAEYGISNIGDTKISQWVRPTGIWANPGTSEYKRIRALRVAVVSRSTQRDPNAAGGVCLTTTTSPATWSGSPAIDLSPDPNWRCYRYRTIKTVFPVKNIIWGNVT